MNLGFILLIFFIILAVLYYNEKPKKSVEIYNSFPTSTTIEDIHVVPLHGTLTLEESQSIVKNKKLDILYHHGIITNNKTDGIQFNVRNENHHEKLYSSSHQSRWIFQLFGSQKLYLFSPEQSKFLYPKTINHAIKESEVNIENPDLNKYPLYSQANYIEILLPANTAAWIPPNWWIGQIHGSQSISIQQNNSSNFHKILTQVRNIYKENVKLDS